MTHISNHRKALAATMISAALLAAITGCTPQTITNTRSSSTPVWGSMASSTAPTTRVALPQPTDFVVGVVITEQKCFGSAGCNYRYTINPQYVGAQPLPDKTTVVFNVTGGEQDQIGNFTIDKDGLATFDRETSTSGPESANLEATVTQVIPGR